MLCSKILSIRVCLCFNSSKTNGPTSTKFGAIGHQLQMSVIQVIGDVTIEDNFYEIGIS